MILEPVYKIISTDRYYELDSRVGVPHRAGDDFGERSKLGAQHHEREHPERVREHVYHRRGRVLVLGLSSRGESVRLMLLPGEADGSKREAGRHLRGVKRPRHFKESKICGLYLRERAHERCCMSRCRGGPAALLDGLLHCQEHLFPGEAPSASCDWSAGLFIEKKNCGILAPAEPQDRFSGRVLS